MDDLHDIYNNLPEILTFPLEMDKANDKILVHNGSFLLKRELTEIIVTGDLYFRWLPDSAVTFSGSFNQSALDFFALTEGEYEFELIIDGLFFGKCRLQELSAKHQFKESFIIGKMTGVAVKGDRSIPVEKLLFSIPNMREYYGLPVKSVTDVSMHNNRIALENEEYSIIIDKHWNYKALQQSLNNSFLSFINGRRTSVFFLHGVYDGEIIWRDFTGYRVDHFISVGSWSQIFNLNFNVIWNKFSELWKNNDDKNFLTSAIHWYLEANKNSGLTEGSIIMAQTALELIYNWLLIEKEGILVGKDAENINAANKIRLLLSRINIPYDVPITLKNLHTYFTKSKDAVDAPEIIVQIRNAIVHSQMERRKALSAIPDRAKYEALQLCLWYIELSLLNIFGYTGDYFNRSLGAKFSEGGKQTVPWI